MPDPDISRLIHDLDEIGIAIGTIHEPQTPTEWADLLAAINDLQDTARARVQLTGVKTP